MDDRDCGRHQRTQYIHMRVRQNEYSTKLGANGFYWQFENSNDDCADEQSGNLTGHLLDIFCKKNNEGPASVHMNSASKPYLATMR